MMKSRIIIWVLFCGFMQIAHAQMMKPSVMVVPSDTWCKHNGYLVEDGDEIYPDYQKAITNDMNLLSVISMINTIMSDRDFPLENLETVLKNYKTENVERTLYTAKDGSVLRSNPLDDLYRNALADIVIQVTWSVNSTGPKKSINLNMQALDSYTNMQVAGVECNGTPSFSTNVSVLLEEALRSRMDLFCERLVQHFWDIKEKGRDISIDVCLSESADFDFTTEYGDYELSEIITSLIAKECVGYKFSRAPSTESMLRYKSVRIPVVDSNGIPMDAYGFGRNIARKLKKEPYNITTTVVSKGLGKAVLIVTNE